MMADRRILAAIDRVFREINGPQHGFMTVRDRLFDMNVKAEKAHRKFTGSSYAITVNQAARLFTVRHIAEALEKPDRWKVDDILNVRLECIMAQAYAARHRDEFLAAFDRAGVKLAEAMAWDYSELVR